MRSLVVLAACKTIIERLNPSAFESKVAEYRRGGLPGQSMSDGRGGGQGMQVGEVVAKRDANGVPVAWRTVTKDAWDRTLRKRQKAYSGHLRRALVELEAAERVELSVRLKAEAVPDEIIVLCSNQACVNPLEPGLAKGECSRCRVHRHRHGTEWGPKITVPAPRENRL